MRRILFFFVFVLHLFILKVQPLPANQLQATLDSFREAAHYPGLSFALVDGQGRELALVSGMNDKEKGVPLKATDKLLQGSVGKTYVAAIALQLAGEGILSLDEKVATYLGHLSWYSRVPNAADVTVRMLLNHTSGIMRYEFNPAFTKALTDHPDKSWQPDELLAYVLDTKPPFAAGSGWEYSDTNYILLGMILEKITGKQYNSLLLGRILRPFGLVSTHPSTQRKLEGLAQGYAGAKNEFGQMDKVIGEDGRFIINPQFEWTGGGVYSTTLDLARWGRLLYEARAVDTAMLSLMINNAVRAKLGRNTRYGLGVIVRTTPFGTAWGHSGFFPGYLTELLYFPAYKLSIAMQANSSDFSTIKGSLLGCLYRLAAVVTNASVRKEETKSKD